MSQEFEPSLRSELALERAPERAYQAYNEAAFRHFLRIERTRAHRSGRHLLLLLLELKTDGDSSERIGPSMAATLFAELTRSIREVDFVGWYRAGFAVGAVLTHGIDSSMPNVRRLVTERVTGKLRDRLPLDLQDRVAVHVVEVSPGPTIDNA
jgi:hypothetical protein